MLWREPAIATAQFERASGWSFKPEGACKGEVCIPLQQPPGETVAVKEIAAALGMPVVEDVSRGWYALGPEAIGGRALTTAQAPELVLPDVDGNPFDLASLRGRKVVVYAWAPY